MKGHRKTIENAYRDGRQRYRWRCECGESGEWINNRHQARVRHWHEHVSFLEGQ